MAVKNIRIQLRAYSFDVLKKSVVEISAAIKKSGGVLKGPIIMPTKIKRITINRSPFVDKKSRDQLEIRMYKLFLDITNISLVGTELQSLELSSDIDVKIKVL